MLRSLIKSLLIKSHLMQEGPLSFDLVVVGAGSGGLAAARAASKLGVRVCLIGSNESEIGGTCVNRGCVPKKLFWCEAERMLHLLRERSPFIKYSLQEERRNGFAFLDEGCAPLVQPELRNHCLTCPSPDERRVQMRLFDWKAFIQALRQYILHLHSVYENALKKDNITVISGNARLVDKKTVQVNDSIIKARYVILATGSHPVIPKNVPGHHLGITSDEFFTLEDQPRRCAIIGGGYVAVELAGVLESLGTEVTLFVREARVLPSFDEDMQEAMTEHLSKRTCINLKLNVKVKELKEGIKVIYDDEESKEFDCVIWAVGRAGNTQIVKDIEVDLDGSFIATDDNDMRCMSRGKPVDTLFAIGDVTGKHMLTPVAIAAGRRLANLLFAKQALPLLDPTQIPSVLFSHPPIGMCGLTEKEARQRHADIQVYRRSFTGLQHAFIPEGCRPRSFYKLITEPGGRIVGVHIFGPGSDEAMQGFAAAMQAGLTKQQLDQTIAIHPTSIEELLGMTE